ncbi:hypothetical protein H4R34_001744 [Dimargaris verticillata]|uniref:Glutamyl-tRNA(Gln) amidotransferase subunit B, mitochondrial n=1 Tax=Dimargaris verticillata TaxID=2761393 RepID=A0A9W8B426_9FUNG|nr:hypothetical protein H4R34_001744 [Dimargaris verticillata]
MTGRGLSGLFGRTLNGRIRGRTGWWEPVIGLEVHAQLNTPHKLFAPRAPTKWSNPPNQNVTVIDAAFPGAMPRVNRECVGKALRVIAALGGEIQPWSRFERKHYFYPDLPQGYQITQRHWPIGKGGRIQYSSWDAKQVQRTADVMLAAGANVTAPSDQTSTLEGATLELADTNSSNTPLVTESDWLQPIGTIRIEQIQLEQDTAKSVHDVVAGSTLIELNRAGAPLVEIVMAPDIRSETEAVIVVRKLQEILQSIGASDARMDEGSLRCDVNVSVRPVCDHHTAKAQQLFGTRVELKNLISLRLIHQAIQAEVRRQIGILEAAHQLNAPPTTPVESLAQETRGFDPATGRTVRLRSKEGAPDYRYMPETDVPPLVLTREYMQCVVQPDQLAQRLPDTIRARLCEEYGLSLAECHALMLVPTAPAYFEAVVAHTTAAMTINQRATQALAWITSELYGALKMRDMTFTQNPVTSTQLASILTAMHNNTISGKIGKRVLAEMLQTRDKSRTADVIARDNGWEQVGDTVLLREIALKLVVQHPAEVRQCMYLPVQWIKRLVVIGYT